MSNMVMRSCRSMRVLCGDVDMSVIPHMCILIVRFKSGERGLSAASLLFTPGPPEGRLSLGSD